MQFVFDPAEQDSLAKYKALREKLRPDAKLPKSTLVARRRIEDLRLLKEVGLDKDCLDD